MPELMRQRAPELTSRERHVLLLAGDDWQDGTIAFLLGIEPEDVAWHLRRVTAKLGADDREGAIAAARQQGLMA